MITHIHNESKKACIAIDAQLKQGDNTLYIQLHTFTFVVYVHADTWTWRRLPQSNTHWLGRSSLYFGGGVGGPTSEESGHMELVAVDL